MSHAHDHAPATRHAHPTAPARERLGEGYAARKHPEFVVLEIGDGVGALIVHADPDLHGVEIEISPDGDDRRRAHKQVLERTIDGRPAFTAVFDGLRAGSYSLWLNERRRERGVTVHGGSVATLDWRGEANQAAVTARVRRPSTVAATPTGPRAA